MFESGEGPKSIWCRLGPTRVLPVMTAALAVLRPAPTITFPTSAVLRVSELMSASVEPTEVPMVLFAFSMLLLVPVVASPLLAMMLERELVPLLVLNPR